MDDWSFCLILVGVGFTLMLSIACFLVPLSSSLQAVNMGEILAHELAHVVTPDDIDHGADWDKAFSAIQAEYFRIGRAIVEGQTEMNRRVE